MPVSGKGTRELSDLEEWRIEEIKKGLAEADRREFASDEEVEQVLNRWTPASYGQLLIRDAHRRIMG
jgi:predicted transcriptional regulator